MKKVICLLVVLMRFASGEAEKYLLSDVQANWFEAQNLCRTWNMNLVTIPNQAAQEAVQQFLETSAKPGGSSWAINNTRIWIGGNDLGESRIFRWIANGARALYTNWKLEEPNNVSENCVDLWLLKLQDDGLQWKWNDAHCHTLHHFICEEPAKPVQTQVPFVLSYGCGHNACKDEY